MNNNNECNHDWRPRGVYKQCSKCGNILPTPDMAIINGIIDEGCDISEQPISDEEEHKDVLPLSDRHDK